MDEVINQPWTRKHDDPLLPVKPAAPRTLYPTSLEDLISFCADPKKRRATAAGSHWSLSKAAIADSVFIETHDPRNIHPAMSRTLFDVVPGCLSDACMQVLAQRTPSFDFASAEENFGEYLVHFETGKRIYQLYAELDAGDDNNPESLAVKLRDEYQNSNYLGSWALETMGSAGGQTVFGALTTGTHGGDFRFPPLADSVVALHLVTDGGKHYWIEPLDHSLGQITDDAKLRAVYGDDKYAGNEQPGTGKNFEIIRLDNIFNAVLIGAWRFGIVYSIVMRARRQYSLHEERVLTTWQDIKSQVTNPTSALWVNPKPAAPLKNRFLQIVVSVTPHGDFQKNLASVTRRWNVPVALDANGQPAGRAERVGPMLDSLDRLTQGPQFQFAGNSQPYSPGGASPIEQACTNANFLQGVIEGAIKELEAFVASNGADIGKGLAAVATAGGAGLLALLPALLVILALLAAFLEILSSMSGSRFGQVMNDLKNELLSQGAAGVAVWQMISYAVFSELQKEHEYEAISYAVMDIHDYLDVSCNVHVDSTEVFFSATDPMLVAFVDQLLGFEIVQENNGKAFVGYISLRFTGPTRALIGQERHLSTCAIEIGGLKDATGVKELMDHAVKLALDPNFKGILHWGQRNDSKRAHVEDRFGDTNANLNGPLRTWRKALSLLTRNGKLDGFSNDFTRTTGLEVVEPQIASLKVVGAVPKAGQPLVIGWDCNDNPRDTKLKLSVKGPGVPQAFQGLALTGQQSVGTSGAGAYDVTMIAELNVGGVVRKVQKLISVKVL